MRKRGSSPSRSRHSPSARHPSHENHFKSFRHGFQRSRLAPAESPEPHPLEGPGQPPTAWPRVPAGTDAPHGESLSLAVRLAGDRCLGRCPPLQAPPEALKALPSPAADRKPLSRILVPRGVGQGPRLPPGSAQQRKAGTFFHSPRRNVPASCRRFRTERPARNFRVRHCKAADSSLARMTENLNFRVREASPSAPTALARPFGGSLVDRGSGPLAGRSGFVGTSC